MKSEMSSTNMVTGHYITQHRPHTLLEINDNSAIEIPPVVTFDYSGLQVMYSPKGITNKWIRIEGDDVITKFDKLFGSGNTNLYGPMATYARAILQAGFRLNTLNVAPEDATHANTYVAFVIKPDPVNPTTSIWAYKDINTNEFVFAKTEEGLNAPVGAVPREITIPNIKFGFESRFINDVVKDYDPEEFLSVDDARYVIDPAGTTSNLDVNIPVFGVFYEGATEYGNDYEVRITDSQVLVDNMYPLSKCEIFDKDASEYEFNFTLFNVKHEGISASFADNMRKVCKMSFTERNAVNIFRPYLVKRKLANKAKTLVPQALTMLLDEIYLAVKAEFTDFDQVSSVSNYSQFVEATNDYAMYYMTQDTEQGRTIETPFSVTTPWTDINTDDCFLQHGTVSTVLKLEGGSSGRLKDILDNEEFDWNIRYDETSQDTPVFIDMFTKAYRGVTDDALWDQALVTDSFMMGDSYPIEIQEAMEELSRYHKYSIYKNHTRPDMTYFRTPHKTIATFQDILNWYETMNIVPELHNTNCKNIVGRAMFEDPSTGGQSEFEFMWDWIGSNSSLFRWIASGSTDSFASWSYSDIISSVVGTATMIPSTDEKETLSGKDINYFTRKSDLTISLGEDTAMYNGMLSILKNVGTSIHFNRIINICTLIARDHPIMDPTPKNIDRIKRMMETACYLPKKHFGSSLEIKPYISTHEMEAGKNVIVYEISVQKSIFSRQNRVVINANSPA